MVQYSSGAAHSRPWMSKYAVIMELLSSAVSVLFCLLDLSVSGRRLLKSLMGLNSCMSLCSLVSLDQLGSCSFLCYTPAYP